jgi:hypothetical protein
MMGKYVVSEANGRPPAVATLLQIDRFMSESSDVDTDEECKALHVSIRCH